MVVLRSLQRSISLHSGHYSRNQSNDMHIYALAFRQTESFAWTPLAYIAVTLSTFFNEPLPEHRTMTIVYMYQQREEAILVAACWVLTTNNALDSGWGLVGMKGESKLIIKFIFPKPDGSISCVIKRRSFLYAPNRPAVRVMPILGCRFPPCTMSFLSQHRHVRMVSEG